MSLVDLVTMAAGSLPMSMSKRVRPVLLNNGRSWLVGRCDLERCARGNLNREKSLKRICHIRKGLYDYQYFNICFLNNMLSLCLKAYAENSVPKIEVINDKKENIWESFFEQPFSECYAQCDGEYDCTVENAEAFPAFDEVFSKKSIKQWGAVYHQFIHFNERTRKYIDEELEELLGDDKRILGVLCRGTDYTECKPKGHPVQPDLDEVMNLTEKKMKEMNCEYIYLATEDGKIDKKFRERFPGKIRINKRMYYDEIFADQELSLIKDVHFEREDDDYWKGAEYLSSLVILSKCQGLIAGNCGGSQTAVFLNGGAYEYLHIFDLGLYGE